MRISVKAKPKSKKEFIQKTDETSFIVAVTEAPEKGKANQAIIKALAKYLDIPASSVNILSGEKSRQKVFEVPLTLERLKKIPDFPSQIKLL